MQASCRFRALYYAIVRFDGTRLFDDVISPWLRTIGRERRWLARLAHRTGNPIPPATRDELKRLYALSRICQLLTYHLQPTRVDDLWTHRAVTEEEVRETLEGIGLEPMPDATFSPLFHEIVDVVESEDPSERVTIDAPPLWRGWMSGPMIVLRAGVRVRGGAHYIRKDVAEQSMLYWAFARKNRLCTDLSEGCGSNSQWETTFRRDYYLDGTGYYNVDGEIDDDDDMLLKEGFSAAEIEEIVRHRCLVKSQRDGSDVYPYEHRHVERVNGP